MPETPEKVCFACLRIDCKQFYLELRELGFTLEDAAEVASWIKLIYEYESERGTGAAFLSGKSADVVKACLAYIGSKELHKPSYGILTQYKISLFFGIRQRNILTVKFRDYLRILQQIRPGAFKLRQDLRFKE